MCVFKRARDRSHIDLRIRMNVCANLCFLRAEESTEIE